MAPRETGFLPREVFERTRERAHEPVQIDCNVRVPSKYDEMIRSNV